MRQGLEYFSLFLVIAIAAVLLWTRTGSGPAQTVQSPPQNSRVSLPAGTDLYMQADAKTKASLIHSVRHFCKSNFHRESCIAYVSKCGRPCLADLNPGETERLLASYKALRRERGLAGGQ